MTSQEPNNTPKNRKPIGNYIMAAVIVVMVVFYLIYINGYFEPSYET